MVVMQCKLKSIKKCVTTHLLNQLALKIYGVEAWGLNSAVEASVKTQWVKRCGGCCKY